MSSLAVIYDPVLRLLRERTGLHFPPARRESAEQGIRRALARARLADPQRYPDLLAANPAALDDLLVELTVGETYFFRDPAQFSFIRTQILPDVRQRRGESHPVRVWSCGCASGEEAYSLAIVLAEAGVPEGEPVRGTDISRAALARARCGRYRSWSLRGEGAAAARPHLQERGGDFVVVEAIRSRVAFDYLNLAQDTYPSFARGLWSMDLVLCRNVLLYFDADTIRAVAGRLFDCLAPGGWLLTAPSDPPLHELAPYTLLHTDAGLVYRRPPVQETSPARTEAPTLLVSTPEPASTDLPASEGCQAPVVAEQGLDSPRSPPVKVPVDREQLLAEAQQAFRAGAYRRANELAQGLPKEVAAWALRVRALANLDVAEAERVCVAGLEQNALAAELHYLHAVLLLEQGRYREAERVLQRVLYLDRSLALAHFTLGSIRSHCGDQAGARRAYANAQKLLADRPSEEEVPLADGEHAGRLAEAARALQAALEVEEDET